MPLGFFCSSSENSASPFAEPTEVLLSVSIIPASRNVDDAVISFSPPEQSGRGLMDMVETICATENISNVVLFNTSYLQRHRIEMELVVCKGMSEEEAESKAIELIEADYKVWEVQNKSAVDILRNKYPKFTILNWYEILMGGSFNTRMGKINWYYNSDPDAKQRKSFIKNIRDLVGIFFGKLSPEILERCRVNPETGQTVKKYLRTIALEECAVRSLLEYPYEIYRGKCNMATAAAYTKFGTPTMMRFVSIGDEKEIADCRRVAEGRAKSGEHSVGTTERIQRGLVDGGDISSSPPPSSSPSPSSSLSPDPSGYNCKSTDDAALGVASKGVAAVQSGLPMSAPPSYRPSTWPNMFAKRGDARMVSFHLNDGTQAVYAASSTDDAAALIAGVMLKVRGLPIGSTSGRANTFSLH